MRGGWGEYRQRPVGGGGEVSRGQEVTAEVKRDGGVTTEGRGKSERLLLRSVKRHRNRFCVRDSLGRDRYSRDSQDIPGDQGGRVISLRRGGITGRPETWPRDSCSL